MSGTLLSALPQPRQMGVFISNVQMGTLRLGEVGQGGVC